MSKKTDQVSDWVEAQTSDDWVSKWRLYKGQFDQLANTLNAEYSRLDYLKIKVAWDNANSDFQRERTETAIFLNELKKKAMSDPGGPYNYLEQMKPIRDRFLFDFRQAYTQLHAAQRGLEQIYGYDVQEFPDINAKPQPSISIFDDCLLWTRKAIQFLIVFGQLDQNYVLPISVKTLIGNEAWNAAAQAAAARPQNPITLSFSLPENLFPLQRYIRLRGLSAFVVQNDPNEVWQMNVTPPLSSFCRRIQRMIPAAALEKQDLDQSDVPPIYFGRVMSRQSQRDPDIVGIAALHNVSPLSGDAPGTKEWKIEINQPTLGGLQFAALSDVQIDLHLAFRSEGG